MKADQFFKLWNEGKIHPTSSVVPEHRKATTTMEEAIQLELLSTEEESAAKKEGRKRVYNKILKKEIPAWMDEYIQIAIGGASDNKEKHFICYGIDGDNYESFGHGGFVNTSSSGMEREYIVLATRTRSGENLEKTARLINKYFGNIGCHAIVEYGGSNKYHGYVLCLSREHHASEDYQIGRMECSHYHYGWGDNGYFVLQGKKIKTKLAFAIYNFLSDCSKEHVSAGVPFIVTPFESKWELHKKDVDRERESKIRSAQYAVESNERQVEKYREYLNADFTNVNISDNRYIPWSIGGKYTCGLEFSGLKYYYEDADFNNAALYFDRDLVGAMGQDNLASLCEKLIEVKQLTHKEYYSRRYTSYRESWNKFNYNGVITVKLSNGEKIGHIENHKFIADAEVLWGEDYLNKLIEIAEASKEEVHSLENMEPDYGNPADWQDDIKW